MKCHVHIIFRPWRVWRLQRTTFWSFCQFCSVKPIHATVALLGRTRHRADRRIRSFQATGLAETCWGGAVGNCKRDPKGPPEPEQASADWNQSSAPCGSEAKPNPSQN